MSSNGYKERNPIPSSFTNNVVGNAKISDLHVKKLNDSLLSVATAINSINGKIVELERCNAENNMLKNRVESLEKTLSNHGKVLNDVHIMLNKLQTPMQKVIKPPSAAQIKAATEAAKKLQKPEVKEQPSNQPIHQQQDLEVKDVPSQNLEVKDVPLNLDSQRQQDSHQLDSQQQNTTVQSDLVPAEVSKPPSMPLPQSLPLPSPSAEVVMEEPVIDDHDKSRSTVSEVVPSETVPSEKTSSKPKLSVATVNDTIEISDVSSSSDDELPPPKPVKKNTKPPLIKGKPRR